MGSLEEAGLDPWLNEPFTPNNYGCAGEDGRCNRFLEEQNELHLWPPNLDQPVEDLLRLPKSIIEDGIHRLLERELKVQFCHIVGDGCLAKLAAGSIAVGPLNDNCKRFYFRVDKLHTVDCGSRLFMIRKSLASEWEMRYINIHELFRVMRKPIHEICTRTTYARLQEKEKMLGVIELICRSFHKGAFLVHFIRCVQASHHRIAGN